MAKEEDNRDMMIQHKAIVGMAALAMICGLNDALAGFTESSAGAVPAVWTMPELGFDSDDTDLHGTDSRNLLGETETGISFNLLSESNNRNGRGLFSADEMMIPDEDKPWTFLDLAAGRKVYGNASAPGWDAAAWLDQVLDVALTNSNLSRAWNLGRLENDGVDIGGNNVYLGNIVTIPEPATYGLITIFGGGLLLFRRRFKL